MSATWCSGSLGRGVANTRPVGQPLCQFAASVGCQHIGWLEVDGDFGSAGHHHSLYPTRRAGTGNNRRSIDTLKRSGSIRHCIYPARAPGCAGYLRSLHFGCGHALRCAGSRHASACRGNASWRVATHCPTVSAVPTPRTRWTHRPPTKLKCRPGRR